MSSIAEEYFEYLVMTKWIDALANKLGLSRMEPSTLLKAKYLSRDLLALMPPR